LGGALFKFALFGINSSDLSKKKEKKKRFTQRDSKGQKAPQISLTQYRTILYIESKCDIGGDSECKVGGASAAERGRAESRASGELRERAAAGERERE
jgi:hypothetical protein